MFVYSDVLVRIFGNYIVGPIISDVHVSTYF
jgi:hypothetical protein